MWLHPQHLYLVSSTVTLESILAPCLALCRLKPSGGFCLVSPAHPGSSPSANTQLGCLISVRVETAPKVAESCLCGPGLVF